MSAANHGLATQKARTAAGYTSFKNTYEGRTTKPEVMVAKFNANLLSIEKVGWQPPGIMHKSYERVRASSAASCLLWGHGRSLHAHYDS